MKYRITLAYDGTDYFGWQMQAGQLSVQEILERALEKLEGSRVVAHAAGRTDAGVHAAGQVVSFEMSRNWQGNDLVKALNGNLPFDIRVLEALQANDDFHARYDAKSKTYRYRIYTAQVMDPFLLRYAMHYDREIDIETLNRDLICVRGTHDFLAFTVSDSDAASKIRTITGTGFDYNDNLLQIYFTGDGFLRYQVRTMVTALLESNQGKLKADSIDRLISGADRHQIGAPAPAKGLTLMKVEY